MAKKKKVITRLRCSDCKERNYSRIASGNQAVGSFSLSKYCARCRKHTDHKETK